MRRKRLTDKDNEHGKYRVDNPSSPARYGRLLDMVKLREEERLAYSLTRCVSLDMRRYGRVWAIGALCVCHVLVNACTCVRPDTFSGEIAAQETAPACSARDGASRLLVRSVCQPRRAHMRERACNWCTV